MRRVPIAAAVLLAYVAVLSAATAALSAQVPDPDQASAPGFLLDVANRALHAVDDGDWKMVAALALILVVWVVRKRIIDRIPAGKSRRLDAALAWLKTERGGVALTALASLSAACAHALVAREPITAKKVLHLAYSAITVAAISSGLYVWPKKLKKAERPPEPMPPSNAAPIDVTPVPRTPDRGDVQ